VLLAFAVAALFSVAVVMLFWLGQRRLIYFPDPSAPSLERSGLADAESVTFTTSDGLRLGAWFVAGSGPSPRPTVVVFPGNAGHRAYRAPLAAALRELGFNVLLTDYRGYGGNTGSPTEDGLSEDARAARAHVLSRTDVDAARLVYFGESLGGAVAVRLAVEHPPSALILRSPFASLTLAGQYHYPMLPVGLLLRDRFSSIDRAVEIRCPVLIIAGTRDTVVPFEHSRRLYEAIVAPKTFVEIDADHNDQSLLDGREMTRAIAGFIASSVRRGQ
jgi:fermentation-respiration switch protein FrsA (DUF1100 family)